MLLKLFFLLWLALLLASNNLFGSVLNRLVVGRLTADTLFWSLQNPEWTKMTEQK